MKPSEAAWKAVFERPLDDRALLVLADALMESGEPHGDLIRRQLAGDGAEEFIAQHAKALLGDEARLLAWRPQFHRGFLDVVAIEQLSDLHTLSTLPIAQLVRALTVSHLLDEGIEELVKQLSMKTLTSLQLGRPGRSALRAGGVRVAHLTAALKLEELAIYSWATDFRDANSDTIERLIVNLQHPSLDLEGAVFSKLDSLMLWLPFRRLDFPPAFLAGESCPALKSLTIHGALWPEQLSQLATSTLLRGMDHLEISAEVETGWYPVLLQHIDAFGHLKRIDLRDDRNHPNWIALVSQALPQAVIHQVGTS